MLFLSQDERMRKKERKREREREEKRKGKKPGNGERVREVSKNYYDDQDGESP